MQQRGAVGTAGDRHGNRPAPRIDERVEPRREGRRRDRGRRSLRRQPHCSFWVRSEEHTSELQSLMRISYAVFCLKKKKRKKQNENNGSKNAKHKTINSYPTHSKQQIA